MVSSDPISDMLTRIRNSILVNKNQVVVPYSKIKESIATILLENKFIVKVEVNGEGVDKHLVITVNPENQNSPITEIKRLSTPGRRHYVNVKNIPIVKRGRGIIVISTSQGIMSGSDARSKNLGGELICKIY